MWNKRAWEESAVSLQLTALSVVGFNRIEIETLMDAELRTNGGQGVDMMQSWKELCARSNESAKRVVSHAKSPVPVVEFQGMAQVFGERERGAI